MSHSKQTLFQAVLARISLGAVPVDGAYWFEPRDVERILVRKPRRPDADWSPVGISLSRPIGRRQP